MSNGKIRYSVAPEEDEAFLKEFKDDLEVEHLRNRYTCGPKDYEPVLDELELTYPDMINPKTEPTKARKIIQNPKNRIIFGEQPFVFPLLQLFVASKQETPPEIEVLKNQYNIYLIKYGISAKPEGKEKITKLDLHLDYPDKFLTYSMTPDTELEEKFRAYANVETKLDTHLNFKAFDIKTPGVDISSEIQSSVEAGFLLHWKYILLKATVVAGGVNSSYAKWTIDKPEQMVGNIAFVMVLCVPKDIKELSFTVKGNYSLHRGIQWWKHDTPMEFKSPEPIIVKLPDVT